MEAAGDVSSQIKPAKSEGGAGPGTKFPSMLKQDEQVNVTSNRLSYDGSASLATYSGNANLWQGETTVKADTIVLDSKSGNLTARSNVTTVMLFEDVDPKTNQRKPTRTTATADAMVYDDAKRLATYTGNESAKAHIAGAQGDLTGDRIDLYLKPEGNELDRMEVNGAVGVIESARTAKGNHMTYTAAEDRYVMTGTPVEVIEVTPPNCKKTVGATLTFRRSVSSIAVEGNGVYGQQSTPVACPAGRS
jgi:lipopolysaccharide export system protein LptA